MEKERLLVFKGDYMLICRYFQIQQIGNGVKEFILNIRLKSTKGIFD